MSERGQDHVFRDHLVDVLGSADIDVGHDAGWLVAGANATVTADMLAAARVNAWDWIDLVFDLVGWDHRPSPLSAASIMACQISDALGAA